MRRNERATRYSRSVLVGLQLGGVLAFLVAVAFAWVAASNQRESARVFECLNQTLVALRAFETKHARLARDLVEVNAEPCELTGKQTLRYERFDQGWVLAVVERAASTEEMVERFCVGRIFTVAHAPGLGRGLCLGGEWQRKVQVGRTPTPPDGQ